MTKESKLKKSLKLREQNIMFLEEYVNLIDMIGNEDQAMIQAMFLGFSAESIGANRVTWYGYEKESKTLFPNVTMVYKDKKVIPYDYYSELKDLVIKEGNDICGAAAEKKESVFVKNVSKDKRYKGYVDKRIKLKSNSLIVIPLVVKDEILGVLEVANALKNRQLTQIDFYVISIITQITIITKEKTKLYDWSVTDNLTQLKNFQYLQISMEKELTRGKRYPQDVGVVLLDIDNFKKINDTYGHPFGNIVLKGTADIIQGIIRDVDIAARYGGDEFLLLLLETSIKGTEIGARTILKECQEKKFITEENIPVHATISIGITGAKKNSIINKDALIKKVDRAMYNAKNHGKNCVVTLK